MLFDFAQTSIDKRYRLLTATVFPRPIAWVSTVSPQGIYNLAPFSFFNVFSNEPPILIFSPGFKVIEEAGESVLVDKDTLANIKANGQFVINLVNRSLAEKMNLTSGDFAPQVSEFEKADLTATPSHLVLPPRVKESPVSFECTLYEHIELARLPGAGNLVLGEILCMHIDDELMQGNRIDMQALDLVGRMGGNRYCTTRDTFDLARPIAE